MAKDGVLVVDKPVGPTSFDMVARARREHGQRRVGHAGTLDPMATGVLLVCLGEATKLVPYLMDADKEYRATAALGVSTDTDDAAPGARVLTVAPPEALAALRPDAIAAALSSLIGERSQRPPRFSALKVDGERLYDQARKARDADPSAEAALEAQLVAKERPVRIDAIAIEALDLESPTPTVTFTVRCGKGTYIRSIARDLGEQLGVGAHLVALRRLRVGRFTLGDAGTCLGLAESLAHLPQIVVSGEQLVRLRQGHRGTLLALSAAFPPQKTPAAALSDDGRLVAVLEPAPGPPGLPGMDGRLSWIIGRGFIV
jgi:tRNA pseudouridine55 synthase